MKVLVTGGCGFLGSHVCEFYANRGDTVISFDNMTKHELNRTGYAVEEARNYNCDFLKKAGVSVVKGDIRDFDVLMEYSSGIDFIVHTAAQPAMTISVEDPVLDFSTNMLGTFNVLRVVKELRIPMVSCGTIHIYGNRINEALSEEPMRYVRIPPAIDESHPVVEGTLTPLHASKRSAELYIETFIHSYGLPIASFRLTGLYGPRQFCGEDHGWVANFSIRALLDQPLRIFGTGKQVRDILYATDAARAFHAFYERGKPGIYNIGGGHSCSISLLECIDLIGRITGKAPEVIFEKMRHGDLLYFVCDTKKAEKEL
ncbi:MAG: NAD-dependent epimerase/dehydratase family protein, partial [Spirochaetes bacterium]|nr:NAD-dependent epimerase/dehydratase family protein [Spirochaetota bacterium]